MPGRSLRVFAAAAALMFLSISGAAAGWYGGGCCAAPAPVVNWGCGNSCAPLLPSFFYRSSCCGSVGWGCGSSCGYGYGNGYGYGYGVPPIHVVSHGPIYRPPLTGYTYPAYMYEERDYPYVGYGGGYYRPFGYRGMRPYGFRGYRYGWRHRHHFRGYPLHVRGQVRPSRMWR